MSKPDNSNADDFVQRYGGIYEHSPWVAREAAADAADCDSLECIAELMADCVDNASTERRLTLIRAHPDLAGRAQIAGELTPDSIEEQARAGLTQCTAEEYKRFQDLNDRYLQKFGFPFVMAVRDSSRAEILAAFELRLANDPRVEFETALTEIHKIARLRLQAMQAKETEK
ncbi:MAG: 2-oxo-4-hydroxy-4-carboxy-5-ureidoimidazoline decarboxylase [Proteobacteria bacterium]|nr:2-oxo-4-hydroxy-4-carboxy-5-ureidoimidazoline decarboxylase [Pseudomonadota bacterium]MDA1062831.1 2-oxo-4-hydroxy-4-carboxy-5-ureidoimidazoline decarboxylase [Pseudomonadota bacterium]